MTFKIKGKYSPALATVMESSINPMEKVRVTIKTPLNLTKGELEKLDFYGIVTGNYPDIESFQITIDNLDALAELTIVTAIDLAS